MKCCRFPTAVEHTRFRTLVLAHLVGPGGGADEVRVLADVLLEGLSPAGEAEEIPALREWSLVRAVAVEKYLTRYILSNNVKKTRL